MTPLTGMLFVLGFGGTAFTESLTSVLCAVVLFASRFDADAVDR